MISCYSLIAVLLSVSGHLNVELLDHDYSILRDKGILELQVPSGLVIIRKYYDLGILEGSCEIRGHKYFVNGV